MNLHKDKKSFEKIINDIHEKTNFAHAIIEKDYYVTMILEILARKIPDMIFRGGTSLSKCYNVINRFSEDIDITVEQPELLTEGKYRKIKQAVMDSINEAELIVLNPEEIRSRRDFNQYKIDYPSVFTISSGLKQHVFVETSVSVRSFPVEMRPLKSIIQEYLEKQKLQDIAKQFCLREFSVRTQKLDRTLVDKLFALGDYYLSGKINGHSRHLYDICKLLPHIVIDDKFNILVKQVREVRKINKFCFSAQDDMNIEKLLDEIIKKETYKKDYEDIQNILMYDNVSYSEAIRALSDIIKKSIFN
jgi:predicted nucleotidyltransferase component of viral defense system